MKPIQQAAEGAEFLSEMGHWSPWLCSPYLVHETSMVAAMKQLDVQ